RQIDHGIAAAHSAAQVDILAAEGIGLVPAAEFEEDLARREQGSAHQHLHPALTLWIERRATVMPVVAAEVVGPAEQLGTLHQGRRRGARTARNLDIALRVPQAGTNQA